MLIKWTLIGAAVGIFLGGYEGAIVGGILGYLVRKKIFTIFWK